MTAHSELVARPALRRLLFIVARCLSIGVLATASATIYWNSLPGPINRQQFFMGFAIMASVIFFGQTVQPSDDGEKT